MSELIYIRDIAQKFGKSQSAIRAAIHRDRGKRLSERALPPSFRLGGRIAWRVADVDAWLARKVSGA